MEKTQWYIGAPNGVILCINQNNEGELGGEFFHSYSEAPVPFQGIGFGEMPKPDGRIHERKRIMKDETLLAKHGDIGTFIVRVQHRQNSSWQGRITWMEEDRTIQFRSVWEMIKLIESAVDSVSQEDGEEINWFPEEDQPGQNA